MFSFAPIDRPVLFILLNYLVTSRIIVETAIISLCRHRDLVPLNYKCTRYLVALYVYIHKTMMIDFQKIRVSTFDLY